MEDTAKTLGTWHGPELSDFWSRSFTYYTADVDTNADVDLRRGGPRMRTCWCEVRRRSTSNEYLVEDAGKVRSETIRGDCSSCGGGGDPASSGVRKNYYYLELNNGLDGELDPATNEIVVADLDAAVRLVIEDTVAAESDDNDVADR